VCVPIACLVVFPVQPPQLVTYNDAGNTTLLRINDERTLENRIGIIHLNRWETQSKVSLFINVSISSVDKDHDEIA
uniref:Uncharacterized protein n=1 Tax=Oryza rufipogon TaxID=4529 RepID=A0A0E0RI24_ORYRU